MNNNQVRIKSIDYLRGIMSLAVVIYHFTLWTIGSMNSGTILGKLGIYAVSIFFVISGMSMYLAYKDFEWNKKGISIFIAKRYLRLFPAFFVACTLVVLLTKFIDLGYTYSLKIFLLNISLLFGFIGPSKYITVGGWSIGCEVVFYLLFPFIMIFKRKGVLISLLISVMIFLYFSFLKINSDSTLGSQWKSYISPINQLLYFTMGIAIAFYSSKLRINVKKSLLILCVSCFAFLAYPSSGDLISIVTGWNRIMLTIISAIICYAVININVSFRFENVLGFFGDISYTVYMFHGVVSTIFMLILDHLGIDNLNERLLLLVSINLPIIIIISYVFYRFIEKPFMRISKKLK
ncbi:acyltransferase [Citrobacter sp. Cpo090]|uniref:acyltransferase family protein n=1 Tax=Citrobacter sp. Cpo090 TaxID=2985139 RepID=UPI0025760DB7|nr:acyltransferase [Citrobacter sp. Cpo090]MDM2843241.1 acyltransferase [Citrobacter sp. Cpo090]